MAFWNRKRNQPEPEITERKPVVAEATERKPVLAAVTWKSLLAQAPASAKFNLGDRMKGPFSYVKDTSFDLLPSSCSWQAEGREYKAWFMYDSQDGIPYLKAKAVHQDGRSRETQYFEPDGRISEYTNERYAEGGFSSMETYTPDGKMESCVISRSDDTGWECLATSQMKDGQIEISAGPFRTADIIGMTNQIAEAAGKAPATLEGAPSHVNWARMAEEIRARYPEDATVHYHAGGFSLDAGLPEKVEWASEGRQYCVELGYASDHNKPYLQEETLYADGRALEGRQYGPDGELSGRIIHMRSHSTHGKPGEEVECVVKLSQSGSHPEKSYCIDRFDVRCGEDIQTNLKASIAFHGDDPQHREMAVWVPDDTIRESQERPRADVRDLLKGATARREAAVRESRPQLHAKSKAEAMPGE